MGPGVHNFRGKKTLLYNGEMIWEGDNNGRPLIYNWEERNSWKVVIILPGVKVIPEGIFFCCENLKMVVMADTVTRIEVGAFCACKNLEFIKLSTRLEYLGAFAFQFCKSLTSIYIPPSCREIGREAFYENENLIIMSVSRHTQLGEYVIAATALIKASPFKLNPWAYYKREINSQVNEWIKNLNQAEEFALHRECASYIPSENKIYRIIKEQGLPSLHIKNQIGVTAFDYLQQNPYVNFEVDQQKLINRLVLELMGHCKLTR